MADLVLALDTSNEVIALGLGRLHDADRSVEVLADRVIPARRASNTRLLPEIDALFTELGCEREQIACVICGRGPGSFTGVRICMATAKGMAQALEVPLYGVSTLDAIAWSLWCHGMRGQLAVAADAMRKELYPVLYGVTDVGPERQNADTVLKAPEAAAMLLAGEPDLVTGDGLRKYAELFGPSAPLADEALWTASGTGLLLAAQAAWRADALDPRDAQRGAPAFALPVYTRLSDAEENERVRLSATDPRDLQTGVQAPKRVSHSDVPAAADTLSGQEPAASDIVYRPLDAAHAARVAELEHDLMGTDAWSEALVLDELPRSNRTWWAAFDAEREDFLVGYAGGLVNDGSLEILKIACLPEYRRRGIARMLLGRIAADARDLGAVDATLEVRVGNTGAQALYASLGFEGQGVRPRYYSDREDAVILRGPLPLSAHDVAGMELQVHDNSGQVTLPGAALEGKQLILAIESSCDETAAAVIDGSGTLLSDVVASQIDFHARFGGVVPEIASRKHIEAICGVTQEGLDVAARALAVPAVHWRDLSAVAVTYAPGLVGALVVGVAFAKGAAWGANIPFIGVNHLEGHLYANKIATPDIQPPMVVSLVSGGHTMLVHVKDWGSYETLGSTVDDAVGEAFDKVAKALGLGYPGGPVISRYAAHGNAKAIDFPRAMLHSGDLRFSLSGLKTAVITYINQEKQAGRELNVPDIVASFQQAVIDVQVAKTVTALKQTGAKEFCLGGGVAANPALRQAYEDACANLGVRLTMPPLSACTDNAGMIAMVAKDRFEHEHFFDLSADACAHAPLDQPY